MNFQTLELYIPLIIVLADLAIILAVFIISMQIM